MRRPPEWRPQFLAALASCGDVRASCRLAGVSRKVAYARRACDPDFATAWRMALDDALDVLDQIARERALASSDVLLIFLLKSHRPEVYREQRASRASNRKKTSAARVGRQL